MQKINFQNLPSTATPLNATNLNATQTNVENVFNGTESAGNMIVDSITSKNIISGWNVGWINNNTGADEADSTARRTNYMNVDFSTSTNYKLSGLQILHCRMFIAAYNVNKQFLGRSDQYTNSSTTNITLSSTSFTNGTPQGTGAIKYLRIVLYTPDSGYTIDGIISSSSMQLEKGNTATTYAPFQNTNGKQFYSTVETKIGTWIDGKNIYRTVITFNPRTDVLESSHSHGISNISEVLPTSCCLLHRTSNQFVPISMAYPSSASAILEWSAGWQVSTTQITTWLGSSLRGQIDTTTYGAVAIIEYTKTTD